MTHRSQVYKNMKGTCLNLEAHRIHGTGICTYHKNQSNVDKYTIHGSYGK